MPHQGLRISSKRRKAQLSGGYIPEYFQGDMREFFSVMMFEILRRSNAPYRMCSPFVVCSLLSSRHFLRLHRRSSRDACYLTACIYVSMYLCMVIKYSRVWINRVRLPILLMVSGQEKLIFPRPRAYLRIWSRVTGSAVPSRVSLLISILRLNLMLTYGIPPEFRGGVQL